MRFVYACISNQCMKPMDEVMKTRKYQKAADLAAKLRIEYLAIDICSSWNRKKPNLESILCEGGHTIVITDVSALGKKDEIADIYQRIITSSNDILICYYNSAGFFEADELSTVTLDFTKKASFSLSDNLQTLSYLSPTAYRVNGGRMVDPQVIEAYWEIEHSRLSITDAIKDLGISRSTFERRVDKYIGTDEWFERYSEEIGNTDFRFSPTKYGRVSDKGKHLHAYLEDNRDEEDQYILKDYNMIAIASFANLFPELFEQLTGSDSSNLPPDQRKKLMLKCTVLTAHAYREVIRYRKYLVFNKYRNIRK